MQQEIKALGLQSSIANTYVEPYETSDTQSDAQSWQLAQASTPSPVWEPMPSSANNGTLVNIDMNPQSSQTQMDPLSETYATSTNVASASLSSYQPDIGYTGITISGTLSWTVGYQSPMESENGWWESPSFTWAWSIVYSLQSANAPATYVEFSQSSSDIPSSATSNGGGLGGWSSVPSSTQELVAAIPAPAMKKIPSYFKAELGSLKFMSNFAFASNGPFTFQAPAINNEYALYATIQSPN
ncbi:hypothetical protein F53441_10475 [Fusarium austroafricanum]|uniref:Uncharacterized protein n=1 Tax=Fusarium austroafricanum TaxID=2364996 RepID=A0A8H4NS91_9HYPO|nr:hypothetical protein F53441_10475 [Fusarium austroafricanum]